MKKQKKENGDKAMCWKKTYNYMKEGKGNVRWLDTEKSPKIMIVSTLI